VSTHCNLLRDGPERAVRHVRARLASEKGRYSVVVRGNGAMRLYDSGRVPQADEPAIVGTYTKRVEPEVIAADLALRLAEITPRPK
jgi:hypothetical protein